MHRIRFVLMHQDEAFLNDRLRQFVAPFAPFAMIGAGGLIILTLLVQWLRHAPSALMVALAGVCLISFLLAPALRWSAHHLRGDLACGIGSVYIATLSTAVTITFAQTSPDLTGTLSFIVILALTPVVFWIKPWHYLVGFGSAFGPPLIAMLAMDARASDWALLLMVAVFTAFVGSLGLFIISACLYIIHEQNIALREISREDDLTRLYRRRSFEELAEQQLVQLAIGHQAATAIYIDLDGFKGINDTYGHMVGDDVLRTTARELTASLPDDAIAGRRGGDEFVALLPRMRAHEATVVAAAFRDRLVRATPPANLLQASIGIAEWSRQETLAELIDRADQLMLAEKSLHRLQHASTVLTGLRAV